VAHYVYGPWETRTITVAGVGHLLPWSVGASTSDHKGTQIGGSGSQPWQDAGNRVAVYNAAIGSSFADHQSTNSGSTTIPAGGGADYRLQDVTETTGYTTATHTDRVFFGTFFDGYDVVGYQGTLNAGVDEWLRTLYLGRPASTSDHQVLSVAEWTALFGPDPSAGVRQFSIPDCTLTLHATFTVTPALTGAATPTVQMRRDTPTTYSRGWMSPALLAGIPVTETANDLTLDLPTEILLVGFGGSVVPTPDVLFADDVASSSWFIRNAMVDRADDSYLRWSRHLDIPQWNLGYDPGYDGDPPYIDGTTQAGGNAASRVGNVVSSWSATVTVKQRIARLLTTTPMLHQVQRPGGVLDAHAAFARCRGTRQSSLLARGML
jgi:hypothetical protein